MLRGDQCLPSCPAFTTCPADPLFRDFAAQLSLDRWLTPGFHFLPFSGFRSSWLEEVEGPWDAESRGLTPGQRNRENCRQTDGMCLVRLVPPLGPLLGRLAGEGAAGGPSGGVRVEGALRGRAWGRRPPGGGGRGWQGCVCLVNLKPQDTCGVGVSVHPPSCLPSLPSVSPSLPPSPVYSFLHFVVTECLLYARCLSGAGDTVVTGTDLVPALVEL